MAGNNLQKNIDDVKTADRELSKGHNLAGCLTVLLIVMMVLLAA